ncbi:MAG: FAD-dependent oxidoreductase, partial [Planctomycetota bacterium]
GGAAACVLLEAEAFETLGGWVADSQFMDVMGSPFLLAHGLGVPVADARTTAAFPAPGLYRVWVRTRDWVAPWGTPGAPGRFQVIVGDTALPAVFGTEGAEWHWQDGGTVEVREVRVPVALRDLTGFEGRADAILFAPPGAPRPPDSGPELAAFRRKLLGLTAEPADAGAYDLVVVGGGIAGMCAALSAARLGLDVALVQDRPVLGGNNSSEVRVWLGGARNVAPWPRVGDIALELEPARRAHYGPENSAEIYEDERRTALLRAEERLRLFLGHRADGVEMDGRRIGAVLATETRTARRVRFAGRWFADCTGDGCLGYLAGADWEMTPKGRMGASNLWHVVDAGTPSPFPRCPWAVDLSAKPFPGRGKTEDDLRKLGVWYWESGFDRDPIREAEIIRDTNLRAMYGAWDALKNVDGAFPNHRLAWAAYVAGKRESRRILGDVVLAKEDLLEGRAYPDGCVPTGWKIDLHLPDPRYAEGFEGDPFISEARFTDYPQPYWIPYRCLYSRSVPNLFVAGRAISVTHEALGAVRVMRTCGCMGEIVGMAAAISKRRGTDPRGVYEHHLGELQELMARGASRDAYGGWNAIRFEATGFFRTAERDGVSWLVTPEGNAFLSKGVNHVSFRADHAPALGHSPYERAVRAKYGSEEAWAKATVDRLRAWGLNTLGSWSSPSTFSQGMAYTINLDLATRAGADWLKGSVGDFFSEDFESKVAEACKLACAPRASDRWLLGYFTDNELRWGADWRGRSSLLEEYLRLSEGSAGRRRALEFLRERHGGELGDEKVSAGGSREDQEAFLEIAAERYFSVSERAIRAADPNHLILGCRFAGQAPEAVLRGMRKHVDVVSFNHYGPEAPVEALERIHRIAGRPVMLTEFSFKAADSGLPNTRGAGKPVPAQKDRAEGFARYVGGLLDLPFAVGFHWFEHADEPKEGRFDGENSNYGLVTIEDRPWEVLTEAMAALNPTLESRHRK